MKEHTGPIVVVDLETLGRARPEDGHIIEIGAVAVDPDDDYREISGYYRLIVPPEEYWVGQLRDENPYVFEMHTKNGLIDELLALGTTHNAASEADMHFAEWLKGLRNGTDHLRLAGSGVLHYDRPYIRRWLPISDKLFTYWAYDTGVMRRMLVLAGREDLVPGAHLWADAEGKRHRALDDCLDVVGELRAYRDLLLSIPALEAQ